MASRFDIRQSITRVLQDQLNAAATVAMDSTLASINNELTMPARLIAASTPSLVVTVGSGTVVNPNTSKNRVLPLIKNTAVPFTGGTITFPSGTGTITVSPGTNASITIGASQFVAVLVQLDSSGNMSLVVGSAAGSLGAVVVPGGSTSFLTLGYIIVQSNGSSVIQNITNAMIYQMPSGGAGSGSGSGTGDDLDALQYKASFTDTFSDAPTLTGLSSVDVTAGHTNATYSATNSSFSISYDASKTVTGTGTSMTLSATPSFTVAVGDILRVDGQARRITVVTSQVLYTIESAFSTNPSGAAATVSQAVYTKDINAFAADGVAISAIYSDSISEALITYNDTTSGVLYNNTDPANVAYTASPDGTTYSAVASREAAMDTSQSSTFFTTSGSNLYIRFFSAKSSGSGTVNLVGYKAFFHRNTLTEGGNIQMQAICFTDGTGTPVGCSDPVVVNGKSRITLTNQTYPVGANAGKANGALFVTINGQKIPRFIDSTLTPNASYTEVDASTIDLDSDYSSYSFPVEIYQYVSVVDSNTQNTTNITTLNTHLFKNYVINGNMDYAQRNTSFSTPASGTYTLDRYLLSYDGTIGTFTVSQQAFTLGQTDVPNEPTYFFRWNQTAAGSGSTSREVQHRVEYVRTLAGKQATLTFYAKADTARTVNVKLIQDFGTGGSPSGEVQTASQAANLTTSWQKFTFTYSVPSISGKTMGTNGNDFLVIDFSLPINTTMTIDLAQVMLNEGSNAAPWVYASGGSSLQDGAELALCQRYYWKTYPLTVAPGSVDTNYPFNYRAKGTAQGEVVHQFTYPVTMRGNPASIILTIYSPGTGAVGKVRDLSAGTDINAQTEAVGQTAASTSNTNAVVVGNRYAMHITVESEL